MSLTLDRFNMRPEVEHGLACYRFWRGTNKPIIENNILINLKTNAGWGIYVEWTALVRTVEL